MLENWKKWTVEKTSWTQVDFSSTTLKGEMEDSQMLEWRTLGWRLENMTRFLTSSHKLRDRDPSSSNSYFFKEWLLVWEGYHWVTEGLHIKGTKKNFIILFSQVNTLRKGRSGVQFGKDVCIKFSSLNITFSMCWLGTQRYNMFSYLWVCVRLFFWPCLFSLFPPPPPLFPSPHLCLFLFYKVKSW